MILQLPSGPFSLQRTRVMGILNTTPDSFYDHGQYAARERAVERALQMVEEGADLIDVGGEKAGPGDPVSIDEEIERVVPVIKAINARVPLPISVDTIKPEVARAAVQAGASIINSISGFSDPVMQRAAVESRAAVVIMHIQGRPRVANPHPTYPGGVMENVLHFLDERVRACLQAGIPRDRIIVDPGPGFGKTTEHDIEIFRNLRRLTAGAYPVLLAASRKRCIGDILGLSVEERLEGSLALVAWGVLCGARIVRVHDVRASKRVCNMVEAVLQPDLVEVPSP